MRDCVYKTLKGHYNLPPILSFMPLKKNGNNNLFFLFVKVWK